MRIHAFHRVIRISRRLVWLYAISLVVLSIGGATSAVTGSKRPIIGVPQVPYEEVHFTSEARDSLPLTGWFLPASGKEVFVIMPGWGGNRSTFLPLAEAVQGSGTNVLVFDPRGGTGRNTYGEREVGDLGAAADWLMAEKGFASSQLVLFGHSMGGASVISYAASHEVGKVVLVSSVFDFDKTRTSLAIDYHLFFPGIYAAGSELMERVLYRLNPIDPIAKFGAIRAPVLLIHGEDDVKAPVEDVHVLQKQYESDKRVDFVLVAGANHTYFLETEAGRQQTIELVREFLTK